MSQANPIIGPNKSGLTYRQEDNDGKKALLNHHKGASAPAYAEAGMLWLDDAATPWGLKMYDGADWIRITDVNATANTAVPYFGASAIKTPMYATDMGSANAYAIAPSPAFGAYEAGQTVLLKPSANNTGTSTLAVSGLSAVTIKQSDGNNLPAGALKTTGLYMLVHNGTHFVVLNPTVSGSGVLQSVSTTNTSATHLLYTIPCDDTIPTSSEGTEVMSLSITPKSATSRIILRVTGTASTVSAGQLVAALFANSSSSAFCAMPISSTVTNEVVNFVFTAVHEPGTTSAVTYKLRAGPVTNTMRMNSYNTARVMGGTACWTLVAEEHV